jgi:hypothetical protein
MGPALCRTGLWAAAGEASRRLGVEAGQRSQNGWRGAVRDAQLATTGTKFATKFAPILATEEPDGASLYPRQDVETPLLTIIKTLVQRSQNINVAPECYATSR